MDALCICPSMCGVQWGTSENTAGNWLLPPLYQHKRGAVCPPLLFAIQPRTAMPTLLGAQSDGVGVCEGEGVLIFSSTSTSFLGGGSVK